MADRKTESVVTLAQSLNCFSGVIPPHRQLRVELCWRCRCRGKVFLCRDIRANQSVLGHTDPTCERWRELHAQGMSGEGLLDYATEGTELTVLEAVFGD